MSDEEWVQQALANMPPMSETKKNELALILRAARDEQLAERGE